MWYTLQIDVILLQSVKFVAARTATDQITDLQLTLQHHMRGLGNPSHKKNMKAGGIP